MPITLDGTLGVTTPMYNGSITANAVTPSVNMKNRIINGAMVIDQRNAGASITANDDTYAVDRFKTAASQSSKLTAQRDAGGVTPPAGFNDYLGYTSSSAYSITSSDYFVIQQGIEGFNVGDLNWGTANAKTVTLSFWVRSSLTGTFGGSLRNSSADRSYPYSYTISSANTWEYKTITIAGDTSGTWNVTNGGGIYLGFGMGVGSTLSGTAGAWAGANYRSATGATSVVGTNGATFYITGVQLEVGSTATSFDYRPYGTELQLCQRYYYQMGGAFDGSSNYPEIGIGIAGASTQAYCLVEHKVTMRSAPTLTYNTIRLHNIGAGYAITSASVATANISKNKTLVICDVASGLTTTSPYYLDVNNSSTGYLGLSSEL